MSSNNVIKLPERNIPRQVSEEDCRLALMGLYAISKSIRGPENAVKAMLIWLGSQSVALFQAKERSLKEPVSSLLSRRKPVQLLISWRDGGYEFVDNYEQAAAISGRRANTLQVQVSKRGGKFEFVTDDLHEDPRIGTLERVPYENLAARVAELDAAFLHG